MEEKKQPFLLLLDIPMREYKIRKDYLLNWPGRVALVVGGSNDMREIRLANKERLQENGVKLCYLHASLWTGKEKSPSTCLLLATETLFSKRCGNLLREFDLVFDMCCCHRVTQEDYVQAFEELGLCDVLQEFLITTRQQTYRRRTLGRKYQPSVEGPLRTEENVEWTVKQRWRRVPVNFMGFKLPDVEPDHEFWNNLLTGRSKDYDWSFRSETLSFNSLPLNHLLNDASSDDSSGLERMGLLLLVCAAQLVSSSAMNVVFQQSRVLQYDGEKLWRAAELSNFLRTYLTGAGKHSLEVALSMLALTSADIDSCQNLDAIYYRDFKKKVLGFLRQHHRDREVRLSAALDQLLTELLKLMSKLRDELLSDLETYQYIWARTRAPLLRSLHEEKARRATATELADLQLFLEEAMRRAASASEPAARPDPYGVPPTIPRGFRLPLNPKDNTLGCTIVPFEEAPLRRAPDGRIEAEFTDAVKDVFDWYGPDCIERRGTVAVFPSVDGDRYLEYNLVATMGISRCVCEHDEELDSDDEEQGKRVFLTEGAHLHDIYNFGKKKDEPEGVPVDGGGESANGVGEHPDRESEHHDGQGEQLDRDGEQLDGRGTIDGEGSQKRFPPGCFEKVLVRFATMPLSILNPVMHERLSREGAAVFVLKRFMTPTLTVLTSAKLGMVSVQGQEEPHQP